MIIDTNPQYNELKQRLASEPAMFIPIYTGLESVHPANNSVLAGVFYFGHTKSIYLVNNRHSDAPQFDIHSLVMDALNLFVDDKKRFLYHFPRKDVLDMQSLRYGDGKPQTSLTAFFTEAHRSVTPFINTRQYGLLVPLTKWHESVELYCKALTNYIYELTPAATFYDECVIPTLQKIESTGLCVDPDKLRVRFPNYKPIGNLVFSEYHPFTLTGRPSNAFGGINFAALNKTDGSREMFVSRFGDGGRLIQMDFDAYHLRLIANQIKYPIINNNSLHEELAKEYYNKSSITDEEYHEGKQKTFSILYGDYNSNIEMPDLLYNIKKYEAEQWDQFREDGYLTTAIAKRMVYIEEPRPAKVFNYFVQSLEFETTITKLQAVLGVLSNQKSKLIQYTYDAILIDCSNDEYDGLLPTVKSIMEDGGTPVTISEGRNYQEL